MTSFLLSGILIHTQKSFFYYKFELLKNYIKPPSSFCQAQSEAHGPPSAMAVRQIIVMVSNYCVAQTSAPES